MEHSKGHVSFAVTTTPSASEEKGFKTTIRIERNYGGCSDVGLVRGGGGGGGEDPTSEHHDDSESSGSSCIGALEQEQQQRNFRHEAILNASRRRALESTRSLRHGSLRSLRESLGRQPSIMSIYSPLEVRRVDSGLPARSLTCVVINVISAGYILLPYGTFSCGYGGIETMFGNKSCANTYKHETAPSLPHGF
jgi:hypothetical protein